MTGRKNGHKLICDSFNYLTGAFFDINFENIGVNPECPPFWHTTGIFIIYVVPPLWFNLKTFAAQIFGLGLDERGFVNPDLQRISFLLKFKPQWTVRLFSLWGYMMDGGWKIIMQQCEASLYLVR